MAVRVFVTGIGIISSIGFNCEETEDSLKSGKTGIGTMKNLVSVHSGEIPVAEVPASNEELEDLARIRKTGYSSRTTLLGIIAAGEALRCSGLDEDIGSFRTGLISATTVGGMDRSEKFFKSYIQHKSGGRLRYIVTHDCGDSTAAIADTFGIRDHVSTISTACSSSANAILTGARLIKGGLLDRVIAGGTDALSLFTLNGFNSLMILDKKGCRPFDEDRNGLTLGEGSAFIVMESETVTARIGKKLLCEVSGYGNACDAYHQTASSPEGGGAYLSMKQALHCSGLTPDMIDYINAHGTGTKNNDLSEGRAIERLFGYLPVKFSSTKAFTGHTLGAAGAVEAVLGIMAIRNGWIYPNPGFARQMSELRITPEKKLIRNTRIRNLMSNSFGFGGNNTSLIFSEC
ncbi:MAG TPA: beta-ketoacyl-[acyl-carrier-protein] synthase family protein [Bacteroidales bacterium]|nr:beta-ketoacyl-[acyl-carrier-protein] synthase family protein [Bacteroidales bacterium]HNR41460.1 beta-ketoacyl-[acyl-carrier-protein] synthase family protein [Bacteroidales bacterium]HPM17809.1 beta-ketoacyl-[acyl-carrier-protein] synthase family protein [Bacteroidales bacterium]HQG77129.1 beta-ketoacyl-[acyl-carrier-protein] synthase family protein [Bacteroidales bacterium]